MAGFLHLDSRAEDILDLFTVAKDLVKRVYIPCCGASSPQGLVDAVTVDPWTQSGKYALGWVYFCLVLLALTIVSRLYSLFTDHLRIAVYKDELLECESPQSDAGYELATFSKGKPIDKLEAHRHDITKQHTFASSSSRLFHPIKNSIALFRYIFYRPSPDLHYRAGWRPISLPSLVTSALILAALAFSMLYSFLPQPLYWQSIQYGSPPLGIRSGMIAVAMVPWIVALSMKANFISMMTGIGHERLNVYHRWLAWLFLLLSLIHTVPFYITPVWDQGGLLIFNRYFSQTGVVIYGTGIAALVPAAFLCLHSLPTLRRRFYELFLWTHVPVSIVLLGMLFWHCANYLTSWAYLWATVAIWTASYVARLFYLNWTHPLRMSWLVGEECAITVMQEDAVKITIPTQLKWKPGQYVYLRMPGVSIFESHPFTIASLCSDDFPSGYGEQYRDLIIVFRPFGGFTKKALNAALDYGPWHTYRAFIDGPYGGMRRALHSFDHVVLVAGGSGITAIVSQLLDLVKRIRDGEAVTTKVHVIWALKRPEIMEWFKEELRICREYAPPDTVHCQFYVTAAKRQSDRPSMTGARHSTGARLSQAVDNMFQNVANNRYSTASSNRYSQLVQESAAGDQEHERQLRSEQQDRLRPLPEAHLKTLRPPSPQPAAWPLPEPSTVTQPQFLHQKRRSEQLRLDIRASTSSPDQIERGPAQEFGFPSTPTEFQKSLMRFAFMPAAVRAKPSGWSTEWGRPDLGYMLRQMSQEWTGRRACVFVCGPSSMRMDVSNVVAALQLEVLKSNTLEEIYLHTENYSL